MAIIVEIVAQDEHTVALSSFDADSVSIGRSLDNDFVVTDPYVDPHHLVVSVGELPGTYLVEDRNTLNGTRLGRRRLGAGQQEARSGHILHLGKTSVRISDSSSSVEPALELTAVDSFYDWAANSLVCTAALGLLLMFASFNVYISSDASVQPAQYLEKLTNPLGTLFVVAAFWTLVGRIVKRRVNFVAHLTIAALTQFIVMVWALLVVIIGVNLSVVTWMPVFSFLGRGLVFVVSIELHLRLATNVSFRRRLIFELLVLGVMFVYPTYKQIDGATGFRAVAPYNSTLLAEPLQFYDTTSTDDFMQQAAETLNQVDLDAAEKRREQAEKAESGESEEEAEDVDISEDETDTANESEG